MSRIGTASRRAGITFAAELGGGGVSGSGGSEFPGLGVWNTPVLESRSPGLGMRVWTLKS